MHPRSQLLSIFRLVMDSFGQEPHTQTSLYPLLVELSAATFAVLSQVALALKNEGDKYLLNAMFLHFTHRWDMQSTAALVDRTDLVEDYFKLTERVMKHAPLLILQTGICAPAVQVRGP